MKKEREFTPPFFVQMTSGKNNEHCDAFPHGSIHEVKKCNEGFLWVTKGIDAIPKRFKVKVLEEKIETKTCTCCNRNYPQDWPFASYRPEKDKTEVMCIRCYERKNIGHKNGYNRDDYRESVRQEILRETEGMREVVALMSMDDKWYFVPKEKSKEFKELEQKILERFHDSPSDELIKFIEEFDKKFEQYKVGSDINGAQLYIK